MSLFSFSTFIIHLSYVFTMWRQCLYYHGEAVTWVATVCSAHVRLNVCSISLLWYLHVIASILWYHLHDHLYVIYEVEERFLTSCWRWKTLHTVLKYHLAIVDAQYTVLLFLSGLVVNFFHHHMMCYPPKIRCQTQSMHSEYFIPVQLVYDWWLITSNCYCCDHSNHTQFSS